MTPTDEQLAAVRAIRDVLLNAQRRGTRMPYTQDDFDADAQRYMELDEFLSEVQGEMSAIKTRFRALGEGAHKAPCGVAVTVTPPNRSFNVAKAVELLNDEQRALCKADGFDAKKVKNFLPPALLELVMEPGSGDARVSVK